MSPSLPYLRLDRPDPEPLQLIPADLPADLDGTYTGLARLTAAEPTRWGAWKLGGTNAGSRAAFRVDRLYYGAIAQNEILHTSTVCPLAAPGVPLAELKGEVEIALRISADGRGWDAWCVALEMPASPIMGLVDLGVVALVADRCAAGALVLGPAQEGPLPGPQARLRQDIDGTPAGEGTVALLTAPPTDLLAEFLEMARAHGAPVAPGQWVATGGITPCLSYRPGQHILVRLDEVPVFDLTINTGSA